MPCYSCKPVLREKLKYAIHFCKSIDTDDYARIALSGDLIEGETTADSDSDSHELFSSGEVDDSDYQPLWSWVCNGWVDDMEVWDCATLLWASWRSVVVFKGKETRDFEWEQGFCKAEDRVELY